MRYPAAPFLIGGNPARAINVTAANAVQACRADENAVRVTGEESLQRGGDARIGLACDGANLNMLSETSIEQICLIAEEQPKLMVIDSIQVMHMADIRSSPGGVAQVRETAAYLTRFAKTRGVAIVMVGHVTKDGSLAGPKCWNTVSIAQYCSTRRRFSFRCAATKPLWQSVSWAFFALTGAGVARSERNPSAIFLSRGDEVTSGSSVMVVWEGTRPLLVEIQALVDHS